MIIRFVLPALVVAALVAFAAILRNPGADWMHIAPRNWLVGGALLLALGAFVSLLAILNEWFANREGVIGKAVGQRSTSFWDNFFIP